MYIKIYKDVADNTWFWALVAEFDGTKVCEPEEHSDLFENAATEAYNALEDLKVSQGIKHCEDCAHIGLYCSYQTVYCYQYKCYFILKPGGWVKLTNKSDIFSCAQAALKKKLCNVVVSDTNTKADGSSYTTASSKPQVQEI